MPLNFQAGPILFRGHWARSGSPKRSRELRQYRPIPEHALFEVALDFFEPAELSVAGPNTKTNDRNWRAWEEGDHLVLQVWSGLLNDWAIEGRIRKDLGSISIFSRPDHPQHNHLEFLIATVLRWYTIQRITAEGGVVLHGALIYSQELQGTFLATGPSGAGKSTISSFFRKNSPFDVFTDESMIALPSNRGWLGFGSPWSGMLAVAKNEGAPLKGIFFLAKAASHSLSPSSLRESYVRLLKELFLPPWNETATNHALANLERLARSLPLEILSFAKDASIVRFLQSQKSPKSPDQRSASNL